MVRHYPAASGKAWLQRELQEILGYMKRECAYYPAGLPVPPTRVWDAGLLDRLGTQPDRNYFVPLGQLVPGRYVLEARLQVISETFDVLVDDCYDPARGRLTVPVSVDRAGDYYFRMYPREPAALNGLRVVVVETR